MVVQLPPPAGAPALEDAHLINYTDGELVWTTPTNENGSDPAFRLKSEEIVFILSDPEKNGGYIVYSLAEPSSEAAGGDESAPPFQLSALFAPQLPKEALDDFLLDGIPEYLSQIALQLIISTGSGTGRAKVFYDEVLRPLWGVLGFSSSSGSEHAADADAKTYQVTETKSSTTVRDFARRIGQGRTTIVLLSGDGGVVDLLNGLDDNDSRATTPTVAVLPLGTGNALFHSLHKPQYTRPHAPSNLVLGLRTLFKGMPAPLPTFRAEFSPKAKLVSGSPVVDGDHGGDEGEEVYVDHLVGAIVASYGFHAQLVWESDTPAYRVHGDKRFGMAAAELLKESHAYDATVDVRKDGDGFTKVKTHGAKFSYVLTTMVSNLEKTFTISPASKPLDGHLRLVHFGDVGGEKTMEIMMAAYREGEHVGMQWKKGEEEEEVGYEVVDEVRVTVLEEDARWRKVCIDGTIVEIEKGGSMSVRREAKGQERIQVLVDWDVLEG
ncbi:ATP-NAD kinase-like domain-containing protein [Apodospora peruviana]|uniref:ATP-NAD kinase-like domain-containing protein n=1 Tax=Apodospora peruviana TaxID=516989 RepID=A0AAE0M649_9PEZI|nr:ATP-NAD kinase-like domain-containing protein [Apodospora peruviana]